MIGFADATELARRIRARDVSPVEVVRALRERADTVSALVTPFEDAEERARAAEAALRRPEPLGALLGVPFTIKDSFDTAGVRTTRGSVLFADRVPSRDATAVARLVAAGAIPLAKTNLPEFALWWETDNLLFGRTVNPWNPDRTAGGSSGGEAAAIASGLSPLGLGSDLGGSIRLPAHYCGVVGFKPTHGRVPLTGHWPDVLLRWMHAGPLARSVRDVSLALSLMAGPDGEDWHCLPVPAPRALSGAEPLPPLRVGWIAEGAFGPVSRVVADVVGQAAEALATAGCAVEPVELSGLAARDCNALTLMLYGAGGRAFFAEAIGDRWEELHWFLRQRLTGRTPPSLEEYLAGEVEVEGLRRDLTAFFRDYDLLLCPTGPVPAHAHDVSEVEIGRETYPARTAMRATIPFDLTGSPALSVPFRLSPEGLPIGVQLVGRLLEDETVLRAGLALETLRGPWPQPPV